VTFEFGLFQFCFDLFDQVIGCFSSLQICRCSIICLDLDLDLEKIPTTLSTNFQKLY
jgi:hypothetical protein